MKFAVLALVAAVTALESAPASQAPDREYLLGVLRRDGVVTPFAVFNGRRWSSPWPTGIRNLELPISLDDVPKRWWGIETPPTTMTIWRDGARAGTLNLTGVSMGAPMCERRIGLKTDYRPATPPPPTFERPFPKDGLVVSGNAVVEPIEVIERGTADANRALILLKEEFDRRESSAAREYTAWTHPVKADQRKLVPITLEAIYRGSTGDPAWTAYYVEAVRQYPPGPRDLDGCGLATFAHGWILLGPKNEANVRLSAKVTYCDRKGVSYMLPFGLIRANNSVYWVFQYSGFEEEWYEVIEPTRRNIRSHVSVLAGACPG